MKKPGFTSQQTQDYSICQNYSLWYKYNKNLGLLHSRPRENTYKKNKTKLWIKNNKLFMNYLNME